MSRFFLDHLMVTVFSLESGAAFVFDTLSVPLQFGGMHLL